LRDEDGEGGIGSEAAARATGAVLRAATGAGSRGRGSRSESASRPAAGSSSGAAPASMPCLSGDVAAGAAAMVGPPGDAKGLGAYGGGVREAGGGRAEAGGGRPPAGGAAPPPGGASPGSAPPGSPMPGGLAPGPRPGGMAPGGGARPLRGGVMLVGVMFGVRLGGVLPTEPAGSGSSKRSGCGAVGLDAMDAHDLAPCAEASVLGGGATAGGSAAVGGGARLPRGGGRPAGMGASDCADLFCVAAAWLPRGARGGSAPGNGLPRPILKPRLPSGPLLYLIPRRTMVSERARKNWSADRRVPRLQPRRTQERAAHPPKAVAPMA
jgi:hypothetical protein